jgi:hypothetical protein
LGERRKKAGQRKLSEEKLGSKKDKDKDEDTDIETVMATDNAQ